MGGAVAGKAGLITVRHPAETLGKLLLAFDYEILSNELADRFPLAREVKGDANTDKIVDVLVYSLDRRILSVGESL